MYMDIENKLEKGALSGWFKGSLINHPLVMVSWTSIPKAGQRPKAIYNIVLIYSQFESTSKAPSENIVIIYVHQCRNWRALITWDVRLTECPSIRAEQDSVHQLHLIRGDAMADFISVAVSEASRVGECSIHKSAVKQSNVVCSWQ